MSSHRRTVAVAGLLALLVCCGAAAAATPAQKHRNAAAKHVAKHRATPKRVRRLQDEQQPNGSFESSLAGWSGWRSTLSRRQNGAVGAWSAHVAAVRGASSFTIGGSPAQVSSTVEGAGYTGSALVRTDEPGRRICLRIREWAGGSVVGAAAGCVTGSSNWTRVGPVAYTAAASGRSLDMYVYVPSAVSGDSFDVDGVSLDRSLPAPAPPTGLAVSGVGQTKLTLSWTASASPWTASYRVTGAGSSSTVTQTSTALSGLACGNDYSFAVVAVGADGKTSDPASVSVSTAACEVASPPATASCDRVASPGANVTQALAALTPGQTLCLHGGTYGGNVDVRTGGDSGSPLTLTSYPGERAKIVGRIVIYDSADDVVVSDLDLDGRNASGLPSPTVDGDRIVFRGNDVTNGHTGICFNIGSDDGYGTAIDVTIQSNRIHDCGRLPATNHDHGIYVDKSRNVRILDNVIYDNADRGIQLYPDAQGTVVEHNVIDGNGTGVIFSGDLGFASSDNVVRFNVISNAVLRYDVESWWPAGNPVGTGNVLASNCLWGGKMGTVADQIGFTATGNTVADPQFVDRAGKDFRLRAGSPCAGMAPRS